MLAPQDWHLRSIDAYEPYNNDYEDCDRDNFGDAEPVKVIALQARSPEVASLRPTDLPQSDYPTTWNDDTAHVPIAERITEADSSEGVQTTSAEDQPIDAQFGPISCHTHRHVSLHSGSLPEHLIDEPSYFYVLTTYLSYWILIAFGHTRDFFGKIFKPEKYKNYAEQDGYAPLNSDWENFYFRRLKARMNDCFMRPYVSFF
jgi:hypothetical protein